MTATLSSVTVVHPPLVSGLRKAETFFVASDHSLGRERYPHRSLECPAPGLGHPVKTEHGPKLAEHPRAQVVQSVRESKQRHSHAQSSRSRPQSAWLRDARRSCVADQAGHSSADDNTDASPRLFASSMPAGQRLLLAKRDLLRPLPLLDQTPFQFWFRAVKVGRDSDQVSDQKRATGVS